MFQELWEVFKTDASLSMKGLKERELLKNAFILLKIYEKNHVEIINEEIKNISGPTVEVKIHEIVKKDLVYCLLWTFQLVMDSRVWLNFVGKIVFIINSVVKKKEVDRFLNNLLMYDNAKGHFQDPEEHFDLPPAISQNKLFVPTKNTKTYYYFASKLIEIKESLLIMGKEYSGKSAVLSNLGIPSIYCRYQLPVAASLMAKKIKTWQR